MNAEIARAFSLDGKVAVITGAASGLGQETARVFALAGARVVLADVNAAGLETTAAKVREAGSTSFLQRVDVTNRNEIEALADTAVREYGRLDSWINSAGIARYTGVMEMPRDAVEKIVSVNMMGVYWSCAAAGRVMKERGHGGTIINVSSTAGDSPVPGLSVYGMTKAAVNQLTKVCAKEFGPFGVRVNAVVPGWIDTPINTFTYREESGELNMERRKKVLEQMAAMSPLGLTGQALDIGMAMLYLATDASRFVTGQLLRVSGGV